MKALAISIFACAMQLGAATPATFHKDVEPILQRRCQGCHHPGDIAPMPLLTYEQARPWAKAIRAAVVQKKMPPWFADPAHGKFLNDESLSKSELDAVTSWVDGGAAEGNPADAPKPREFAEGWHIGKPDAVITIPKAFHVPAKGTIPYQYIVVPTNFTEDKWVQAVEVRPSNRKVVHHIIASSSVASTKSARGGDGGFFTFDVEKARVSSLKPGEEPPQFAAGPESEMLQVFVPGGEPPELKPGQAKLIKAGSNIMFQLHYTTVGTEQDDQTSVGLIFAKAPPTERIKGILVFNTHFTIPAGEGNHMLGARAEVLHDMKMVAMLPHMHLRGKDFQYKAIYPSGESEILLNVPNYDFNWQINYYLAKPKFLPKGTVIECTGHYDNSVNNRFNPDATTDVHYGEQTWEEMLNGFMDVAIEPNKDTPPLLGPGPGPFLPVNATAWEPKPTTKAPGPDVAKLVSFHKDVEPILQEKCQGCHRPGEVAPMPFLTYSQARPWAKAIRAAVVQKKMPPWFADPAHGQFANDRRLSAKEIDVITRWADSGALEGNPADAPKPVDFAEGWAIGKPDMVIEMSKPFVSKASGDMPYQYIVVPSGLTEDRWVEAAEIRPGNRNIVHHVIAFAVDPKKSPMGRGKLNEFLDADAIAKAVAHKPGTPEPAQFSSGVDSESLGVYVPGYLPPVLAPNQARLLKAGSVILFQVHYTSSGKSESDVTRIGIRFAKNPPTERVKMVNVQNFWFSIPPNVDNYPITAKAELTRDVKLISLQPHMHLRGKTIEYRATYPSGESEVLLSVPHWDFNWQLTYVLAQPKLLPKGTIVEVSALFDNSKNNAFNPDANAQVLYGEQTWNEMMGGLMDIAIEPGIKDPEIFKAVPKSASVTTASR